MSDQTSEAIAYIEREYKDLKGRIEYQRRVVEQLQMVEADAAEAEASLAALLDDEASKLRILDYLRKWRGDKLEENTSQHLAPVDWLWLESAGPRGPCVVSSDLKTESDKQAT